MATNRQDEFSIDDIRAANTLLAIVDSVPTPEPSTASTTIRRIPRKSAPTALIERPGRRHAAVGMGKKKQAANSPSPLRANTPENAAYSTARNLISLALSAAAKNQEAAEGYSVITRRAQLQARSSPLTPANRTESADPGAPLMVLTEMQAQSQEGSGSWNEQRPEARNDGDEGWIERWRKEWSGGGELEPIEHIKLTSTMDQDVEGQESTGL